ncbi:MAG: D-glycero-beta-D-manno-heptose 1-phosphate adenylyltransferase [Candidatus Latescibacteria bacterium]|nr:D-glycero-beta-D-manno-heptose 1-phosphate adenylyltransferase [Candidatus Latescibacterota bacterium]
MDCFEWTPSGPRPLDDLLVARRAWRAEGRVVVTTNGCFDLLHPGHVRFLQQARARGELLIVGLNSDASVRQLKGPGRPLLGQDDRAAMLAALRCVDHVVIFAQPLANELLARLQPDIHCKGGDYTAEALPEAEIIRQGGGQVCILPFAAGYSTTGLLQAIRTGA